MITLSPCHAVNTWLTSITQCWRGDCSEKLSLTRPSQPGRVETPGASQPSSNIHEHYGNLSPGYFPPSRDDTVTTDMMDELQSARDSLAQYWRCAVIKTANSLAISWWSQRRPELKANLTSHCSHSLHIILYLAAEREREREEGEFWGARPLSATQTLHTFLL